MKENQEKALSLKAKDEILQAVFKEYQYAKETLEKIHDENYFPKVHFDYIIHEQTSSYQFYEHRLLHRLDQMQNSQKLIRFVDEVLARLPPKEREILTREYIDHAQADWWKDSYARSSYYRTKNRALDHMLEYLMLS